MQKEPKILIVDDEPFNIDYLEQELEDMGYTTISAANGEEGLTLVERESPDMILLDIMMPVMNGFEMLKQLKSKKAWRDIPVVVISAMDDMSHVAKGIELGAEDFLPKPFEPILLKARLSAGLEKKRLHDLEQEYLKGLERELDIAREIQSDFLPKEILQPSGWEIATAFRAAREVAGDFYDVFPLTAEYLGLILGDVVDKGVGSALYMALFRSLLRAASDMPKPSNETEVGNIDDSPSITIRNAVQLANDYICEVHESESFTSLFFGALNTTSGELHYINAGHVPPLVLNANRIKAELSRTGPVVGLFPDEIYGVDTIQLDPSDLLLVYSDGFTDVQNQLGEIFEKERFYALLDSPYSSAQSLVTHILGQVTAYSGDTAQFDDMTMLAVKRIGT
jgi:two-component system response regulator